MSYYVLEALMCKWLGKTPAELRRMPYHEKKRLETVYKAIMTTKPEMMIG